MVATRGGTRVQYQEESGTEEQATMEDVKQIVTRSRRSSGQSNADVSEAESTSSNPTTRITRSRQSLGHLENSPRILRSRQSTLMTEPIIESIEGELSDAESNCSSVSTRARRKPPRHASHSVSSRSQKSGLMSESISDHSEAESNCSSVSGVQCIATRSAKKTSIKCPSSPILEYQQKEISDNESCSSGYTLQPIAKRLSRRKEGKLQSDEEKCANETSRDSKEQMALKRQRPNLRELTVSGDLTTVAQQNILSSPRRSSRNQPVSQRDKDKLGSIRESPSKEISGKDECVNETSKDSSQEEESIKKKMPYLRNLTVSEELSTVAQQILSSPRRSLRNQPVSQRDDVKAVSAKESLSKEISDKVSGDIECVTENSRDSSPEHGTLNKQKPSLDGVTVSGELSPGARRNILSPRRSSRSHSVSRIDAFTETSISDSQSKENINKLSAVEHPEENAMPVREVEVGLPVEGKATSVVKLCISQPTEKVLDQMIDLTEDSVDEEQIQNTDDDDDNSVTKNKDLLLILDSNSDTGDDLRIEEDNEMVDEEAIEMEGDLEMEAEENNTPHVKIGPLQKASTQPFTDVVEDGLFVIDKAPGLDSSKKYYVDPNEGQLETENEESENEDLSELDDDDFIDEDEDEELLNRPKRGFVLSTSIDTGINIKKMGGLYINFDAEKPNPGPSFLEKLKKESKKKDELLQKSIITPDFEKKESVPPYTESLNKLKKQRKEEREKTTGCGWFDMKAPEMTAELKNDLKALKMRSAMDPKHFYKKNDRDGFPKYFQVGTVVDNPVDYYHSRIPKKQRKRTIVEELLADSEFRRYNKKKYQEILAEKAARAEGKKKRKKKKFHT